MNKILLFTCLIISGIFVLGQAPPNGFNYSAVARDANGNLVTDQAISLRMSIIAGSAVGTTVYQEVHSSNTDDYGMFNLTIGTGAIMDGSFAGINWADNTYHLKIEMDITGGMNYTNMGTTQFLSVPYAMHAATADSVTNQSFQTLSISGDTIFLTNGGFVTLDGSSASGGGNSSGTGPNAPLPAITTTSVSNITSYTALCGGDISHDGGTAVTERGVCWNNSPEPTIDDNRTLDFGGGTGSFSINFSGLQLNTTYYVRAFAINNTGISYGNELSFTTTALNGAIGANLLPDNGYCSNDTISISSCNGQTSLSHNGHDYELVEIGGQCWFKENLQTTTFRNGNPLYKIDSNNQFLDTAKTFIRDANCVYHIFTTNSYNNNGSYLPTDSVFTSAYTWPNYDSNAYANPYGALYNYYAVTDPNELCPTGWHIPTDCEWMYLENTLGINASEQQATGYRGTNQGGMLKSINNWAAPNTWATNSSGFNGMPSGFSYTNQQSNFWSNNSFLIPGLCSIYDDVIYYYNLSSNFSSLNSTTSWWSSNDYYYRELGNSNGGINRASTTSNHNYKSVRCLKD
jgi:uncharacterized protein (TIGR02145 family)